MALETLRDAGVFKTDAFVAWLDERDIKIDRTLVSHWRSGRSHLPADVLPLIAEFTERPELVYGSLLRAAGCELVRLKSDDDDASCGRDILQLLLEAGSLLGELQRSLLDAVAPSSPGGTAITPDEKDELVVRLDTLIHQLVGVREELVSVEGDIPSTPSDG